MKSAFVALGLATLVAADFQIFAGQTNDPFGGGTGGQAVFFQPDVEAGCDNQALPNIIFRDDASGQGVACDGCREDQAPNDWEITRFEMFDAPGAGGNRGITLQEYGSLTAFAEGGDTFGLNARDPEDAASERRIGRCERVRGDQITCVRGLTTDFLIPILNCFGETEPIDLKES